jgi:hypothetical protein
LIIQPSRLSRKALLRSSSRGAPAGSGGRGVGDVADIFTPKCSAENYIPMISLCRKTI